MLNNMRIATRLGLGFGIIVAVMVAAIVFSLNQAASMNERTRDIVDERWPQTVAANDIIDNVNLIARSMAFTVVLSRPEQIRQELDRIQEARKVIKNNLEKLETQARTDQDRKALQGIKDARGRYVSGQDKFLRLVEEGKREEAIRFLTEDLRGFQQSYIEAADTLAETQGKLMGESGQAAQEQYLRMRSVMLAVAAVAVLISIALSFFITRSVTRPMVRAMDAAHRIAEGDLTQTIEVGSRDETGRLLAAMHDMQQKLSQIILEVRSSADNLASASEQVSATSQSLSQSSSEQAASVEETSASIEQMSASISQNADNAKQADQLSTTASNIAVKGGQMMEDVVNTMSSISDSSSKIASIISVIDSIAFQTNILALNAAVEAARAGEQGRGFAVVATEVRNLAQRSATAAREIKALIDDSVEKVENGTHLVDEAGRTMEEIVTSVKHVAEIMSEITAASQEQSSGIEQVNQAVIQMDDITQQNAALVEEAAASAESLKHQARDLAGAISIFKVSQRSTMSNIVEIRKLSASKALNSTKDSSALMNENRHRRMNKRAANNKNEEWDEF